MLVATYVAAAISTTSIAGHQVAFTVWTFLAFALDAMLVFTPLALVVRWLGLGLPGLWWAFTAFMAARLATLLWRQRRDD